MKKIRNLIMSIIVMMGISLLASCTPEPCYDEVTYHYQDGTSETVIVEYDCSNLQY